MIKKTFWHLCRMVKREGLSLITIELVNQNKPNLSCKLICFCWAVILLNLRLMLSHHLREHQYQNSLSRHHPEPESHHSSLQRISGRFGDKARLWPRTADMVSLHLLAIGVYLLVRVSQHSVERLSTNCKQVNNWNVNKYFTFRADWLTDCFAFFGDHRSHNAELCIELRGWLQSCLFRLSSPIWQWSDLTGFSWGRRGGRSSSARWSLGVGGCDVHRGTPEQDFVPTHESEWEDYVKEERNLKLIWFPMFDQEVDELCCVLHKMDILVHRAMHDEQPALLIR